MLTFAKPLAGILTLFAALGICGCGPRAPTPAFEYVASGGCGDIFLYRHNQDQTAYLVIQADKKKLGLSTRAKTFDLEATPDGLEVRIDLYSDPALILPYCTDIEPEKRPVKTSWHAKTGIVTITLGKPNPSRQGSSPTYQATVKLENTLFEDEGGSQVQPKGPIIVEATVGW
jgi:hypothetical protein